MAKLKEYKRTAKIPGLPDTTNITDPQLRLFLDRIKMFCSELEITVKGMDRYSDIENIISDLFKSDTFMSALKKNITQTVKPVIDDKIDDRTDIISNDVRLKGLRVIPGNLTINTYINDDGNLYEQYLPTNTSARYKGVTWSSSDVNIATVDQSGTVTAVAVGECIVTATSKYDSGISASSKVSIVNMETITVVAEKRWCNDGETTIAYTESETPSAGDCLWSGNTNTVTLYPDKSEYESKKMAAWSVVASTDKRDYIVQSGSSLKYWRNKDEDHADGYTERTVYLAPILKRNKAYGDSVYIEAPMDYTDQKRIFSSSSEDSAISDTEKNKFLADNLQIGITKWQDVPPPTDSSLWFLSYAADGDGELLTPYSPYGYMTPTGKSVTLTPPSGYSWFEFGFPEDFSGKFHEFKTFDGRFTAWVDRTYSQGSGMLGGFPSKPYFGEDEYGYPCLLPKAYASNGRAFRDVAPITGSKYTEVDGKFYCTEQNYVAYEKGYVWDADIEHYAWTTTPCNGGETIYSEKEKPSAGDNTGIVAEDGSFTVTGTVSLTGNGTCSLTAENGTTLFNH